jgi:ankyrin repeat protein/uncharacterized glyoxalase superfamily protein PhnB
MSNTTLPPEAFFSASASGDNAALTELLDRDPGLVHQKNHHGATALHVAVPHPATLRLLLARGADPNVRDAGDNALALHFAAGRGPLESVRALLDGGSDVHGAGDVHRLEVIGWATVFEEARRDVLELLIERGAKHHVFSAIAINDPDVVQRVIEDDPQAIHRRLSRFEQEQSALHYVIAPPDGLVGGLFRTGEHYRTLEVLIELGADLEAVDAKGRTPLAIARLRGDQEAISRLRAAGAKEPAREESVRVDPAELAASIRQLIPMLGVPDVDATVAWYRSIGFELTGSHSEGGRMDWASMKYGGAQVMFAPSTDPWRPKSALSLWLRTDRLDDLYASLKERQLALTQDLHTAFYGQRELALRDPNGVELYFFEPAE